MSDFEASEQELGAYFTSSLGVKAQSYEGSGGGAYDTNDAHLRLRESRHREELERFRIVDLTMGGLAPSIRERLSLVYSPHGWPGPLGLAFARLPPRAGGVAPPGSFVALALRAPAAIAAVEKSKEGAHGTGLSAVFAWLSWQAGLGHHAPTRLIRAIMDECADSHREALASYEPLRRARVEAERAIKRKAKEEREQLLERELRGAHIRRWGLP